ncbi:MAG: hypothetical protein P8M16_05975, partial [Acidimicrobiales bacterium]|nr:hypothetical protein [Acidimicrobiales bacterium]
ALSRSGDVLDPEQELEQVRTCFRPCEPNTLEVRDSVRPAVGVGHVDRVASPRRQETTDEQTNWPPFKGHNFLVAARHFNFFGLR